MNDAKKIRVVRPTDKARTIIAAGDEYRYLATGKDTDGEYFLFEAIVPPGGGPPLHIQTREEEAFYILDGELTFYTSDGEVSAGPGTYINVPKGAPHRFKNNTEQTAKMLVFFAPAGIEKLFDQFPDMDPGDKGNPLDALNEMGRPYGVKYVTP